MDVDHSGFLDESEFAHLLGLPPGPTVSEIFHLLDKNGDGLLGTSQAAFRFTWKISKSSLLAWRP